MMDPFSCIVEVSSGVSLSNIKLAMIYGDYLFIHVTMKLLNKTMPVICYGNNNLLFFLSWQVQEWSACLLLLHTQTYDEFYIYAFDLIGKVNIIRIKLFVVLNGLSTGTLLLRMWCATPCV